MNIFEVISKLKEKPGESYTAIAYNKENHYLSTYTVSNEPEDPEWITAWFEGGKLFDWCSEEGAFSIEEFPEEMESLQFKPSNEYPDFSGGYLPEYIAYTLFPDLPDPEWVPLFGKEKEFALKLAQKFE
jgi:hypothetical protein